MREVHRVDWKDFIKKVMLYLNLEGSVEIFQVVEEAKSIANIRKGVEI